MTGVATLKDPRRSAIADIASRLSSRSPDLHPSLFLYLSIFLFLFPRPLSLRLPSPLSLTAGSDDTRVPYSAVNHGQREVERAMCPAVPKTKIADPKKTTFICIEIFGRAFIPKPAAPVGVFAERLRRFLFPGPSGRRKLPASTVIRYLTIGTGRKSRENRINTVKTGCHIVG